MDQVHLHLLRELALGVQCLKYECVCGNVW